MATLSSGGGHGYGEVVPPDHGGVGHVSHPPVSVYFIVYVILLVLLVATVGMYYVDLNKVLHVSFMNIIVALIIAVVKALLVILFFMNVKGSTRLTWLWAGLGFFWVLLMSGVFLDYLSRAWVDTRGWQ